jgi:hypothetical protein
LARRNKAATKIQALWRGYSFRKNKDKKAKGGKKSGGKKSAGKKKK